MPCVLGSVPRQIYIASGSPLSDRYRQAVHTLWKKPCSRSMEALNMCVHLKCRHRPKMDLVDGQNSVFLCLKLQAQRLRSCARGSCRYKETCDVSRFYLAQTVQYCSTLQDEARDPAWNQEYRQSPHNPRRLQLSKASELVVMALIM